MIKLLCLALFSALAAVFCAQHAPVSEPGSSLPAEMVDRQFLAELNAEEGTRAERVARVARADREFLAQQQANDPIPVAIPVRRAIPVQATEPARTAPMSEPNIPRAVAVTRIEPEIRRAIPVAPRRASIVIHRGEVVVAPAVMAGR